MTKTSKIQENIDMQISTTLKINLMKYYKIKDVNKHFSCRDMVQGDIRGSSNIVSNHLPSTLVDQRGNFVNTNQN